MARILVIDDEAALRGILEKTLKAAGHDVILASDGKEGIEQFRRTPADLVITDLFMPNQDGVETIKQLRNENPKLAIIGMSGT